MSFQTSYLATGMKLKGAQRRTARNALSAATWKADAAAVDTFGSAEASRPCLSGCGPP